LTQSQPPITRTTHTLPFDKLSPRDFERLCLWLVEREGYQRVEHLGVAADEASSSTARVCAAVSGDGQGDGSPLLRAYLEGYRAALTTVALAFGLSPAIISGRVAVAMPTKSEVLVIGAERR
jgi:hypothetical protein